MVDGAALEMLCPERDLGFESLTLRQIAASCIACGDFFAKSSCMRIFSVQHKKSPMNRMLGRPNICSWGSLLLEDRMYIAHRLALPLQSIWNMSCRALKRKGPPNEPQNVKTAVFILIKRCSQACASVSLLPGSSPPRRPFRYPMANSLPSAA